MEGKEYKYEIDGVKYRECSKEEAEGKEIVNRITINQDNVTIPDGAIGITYDGPYSILDVAIGSYIYNNDNTVTDIKGLDSDEYDDIGILYGYLRLKNTYPVPNIVKTLLKNDKGEIVEVEEFGPDDYEKMSGKFLLPNLVPNRELLYISGYKRALDLEDDKYVESSLYLKNMLKPMLELNQALIPTNKDNEVEKVSLGDILCKCMLGIYNQDNKDKIEDKIIFVADPEAFFFLNSESVFTCYNEETVDKLFNVCKEHNNLIVINPIASNEVNSKGKYEIKKIILTLLNRNSNRAVSIILSFTS